MITRSSLAIHAACTALVSLGLLAACTSDGTAPPPPVMQAVATLRDAAGQTVGTVHLSENQAGTVAIQVSVSGLSAGARGIHLHSVGSCAASGSTAFGGAGGHFNPLGKAHGLQNPNGAHGGDLPNLEVGTSGTGQLSVTTDRVTLTAGPISLLDADGAAVVLHAGPDDQSSDPAGNSGARIACGVVQVQ